jgi:predicted Zn-dependent peptidase
LEKGIDSDLLNTVKCAMYGDVLRRFNSCENIASQMAECAMFGYSLFDEQSIIASVNADDVMNCLSALKEDKSVLSVINPM